ncbi:unnamed protein product [Heterobilharzia americana]|nr:unnamed protein product [Heterobilharzia americana]
MNYQGYHENKMKSSQYTQRIEQYPNPYENHCGYSEVYYDTEKHQHILPSQYQPPAVTHYPHSLKLKRSCHNTKCRYCFPDTCNNVLTQFDLESKSSSSESASQIVTRNSVNNHNSYKKFLEQKSRPTCVIQEEIECDETQMDEEKGRRIVGQYTEEMIPVYREIRVNTPVVQHITPSNIIDNNLPVMHNNTYHTEDRRDVYWSNKQVPLSVCTNGNSSIGSSNYNNGPTVVKNRQRDSFNQSNSDRGVQYESITLSTDTARSSLITDPLAEHEISSRYAKFNSQLGSKKNMLLRNDFKKLPEKPMEPGMYRMTESRRLRLNPLTSCPEESQSIAYRGESILKSGGLRNHEFETQALNYNRYNHYHHCDQSIFLSLGSTHRLKKNLTHSNPSDDGNFSIPKRTMSHTNVYGPRSWNLRSYQGSESDLAYKREMSSSSHLARSGYSARRERLKQEREQELVRQTRLRQMAASSTGLHDHRHYQQQNVHNHNKQHYRSTSAVNRSIGSTEAFEEFETITLQPIGRGVQDLDSHVGSMTTLARGGGASSMIEEEHLLCIAVHRHTVRTPRVHSPSSYHFNRAHSTTPTRYSRPARRLSNCLHKRHSAFGGSGETYPSLKSRTPDPGRDITGSPLWSALPRRLSTSPPVTCKSWKSERNVTATPLEPISYEDVMPNTQMAKIQVLESNDLPAILTPYSRQSSDPYSTSVTKKDAKMFESHSENIAWNNHLDGHESETVNLRKVVSLKRPPERSKLWALTESLTTMRPESGYLPTSPRQSSVIDEDDGRKDGVIRVSNSVEPGKTVFTSEINGLSHVDDHHHARAGSRASLARQPFASTQCLNRQNLNHEGEHTISINRIQPVSSTPVQSQPGSRLGTPAAFTDHVSGVNNQQTVIGPTKVISNLNVITTTKRMSESTEVPTQNGWKSEKTKLDVVESSNMAHVNATARVWYRPKLSREEAISILRQQVPGSFLIRDSTTYKDAFGLAVKVATLPPKVTPKSDDLQSELVRHYLIEAVNTPTKGVRLKGFASEPVFPSLAALINRHTQDALALPCRLILPAIPTTPLPQGYKPPPQIVTGIPSSNADIPISNHVSRTDNEYSLKVDSATGPVSEIGSVLMDNTEIDCTKSIIETSTVGIEGLPFECVVKDDQNKQMVSPSLLNQGMTYRCFMLGSVDTPQWNNELCFSRAVDQLIPLETLTASECDHGISRVRYSDIQLHVSAHDGITIIDLLRRLFLRRHLPNNVLLHCGVESRKKEFIHPEHQNLGIRNPKIFGLVVRKGISECTCHIFSECDPVHSAESIVKYIRSTYPHLKP